MENRPGYLANPLFKVKVLSSDLGENDGALKIVCSLFIGWWILLALQRKLSQIKLLKEFVIIENTDH